MFSFSHSISHSSLLSFSYHNNYLATSYHLLLNIYDTANCKLIRSYPVIDKIYKIEWSHDNKYILIGLYDRNSVNIYSIENSEFLCKYEEKGLYYSCFVPSNKKEEKDRLILTSSITSIKIYSLLLQSQLINIPHPKYVIKFSSNYKYLAVGQSMGVDYISIYNCDNWDLIITFPVECINMTDILWSNDNYHICVSDHTLENRFVIYNRDGKFVGIHQDSKSNLKNIAWAPSGQFIAAGSSLGCKLYNNVTWGSIADFRHNNSSVGSNITIFKEKEDPLLIPEPPVVHIVSKYAKKLNLVEDLSQQIFIPSIYETCEAPIKLNSYYRNEFKKDGVNLIEWSHDSKYLATKDDNYPNIVWIWETSKLSLHSLVLQLDPIKSAKWHPKYNKLIICTGNNRLYMWTDKGCCVIDLPIPAFSNLNVKWNYDGSSLLLIDQMQCCICYLEDFFAQDELDSHSTTTNVRNKSTQDDIANPNYVKLNEFLKGEVQKQAKNVKGNKETITMPRKVASPFVLNNGLSQRSSYMSTLSPALSVRSMDSIRSKDQVSSSDLAHSDFSTSVSYRSASGENDSARSNYSSLSLQSIAVSPDKPPIYDSAKISADESLEAASISTARSKTSVNSSKSLRVNIPTLKLKQY